MKPTFKFSVAFSLMLFGCTDNSAPIFVMTPAKQAELDAEAEATRAKAELEAQLYKESGRQYGEPTFRISAEMLSEENQNKLRALLPDRAETNAQFVDAIELLRTNDPWLDAAVDDPWGTSMVRPNQTPPGPPLLEFAKLAKQMTDLIRDEYLRESQDSEESKAKLIELYEANMLRLLAERSIDDDVQTKIFDRHLSGEVEPLLLLMNLSYTLTKGNRYQVSIKVLEGLQSRKCSPWTKIALIRHCKMDFTDFPPEQRRQLSMMLFDAVGEMLREISKQDDWIDEQAVLVYNLRPAFAQLNSHARVELVERIVNLYQSDDCPAACDEYFVHSVISQLHYHIARHARGGDFIYKLTDKQNREFSSHSELNTYHLMRAFVLRPDDVFGLRRIMEAQLVSSDSPYTVEQLFRVAQTMAYDYQSLMEVTSSRAQPRWGGSRRKQQGLLKQTVELALIPQSGEAIYDEPLNKFLYEVGTFGNLSKRLEFPQAMMQFQQQFLEPSEDVADERQTFLMLMTVLRLAWDRSDLPTVATLVQLHGDRMSSAWLHHFRISPDWLNAFINAYRGTDLEQARQALATLHRELIVGDEQFDDARLKRVEEALATIVPLADAEINALEANLEAESVSPADDQTDSMEPVALQQNSPAAPSVWDPVCSWHKQDLQADPRKQKVQFDKRSWMMIRDGLARLHQVANGYHAGQSVEIIQGHATDWNLMGNGLVQRNAGDVRVTVHNRDSTFLAEFPIRFELPFELEMIVRQGSCDADAYGMALFAGPVDVAALSAEASGRSLRYSPGYPMLMQDRLPRERLADEHYHEERMLSIPSKATLKIRMTKNGSSSFYNDRLVTETSYINRPLGIVGFGRRAGDTFVGPPDRQSSYTIESFKVTPL